MRTLLLLTTCVVLVGAAALPRSAAAGPIATGSQIAITGGAKGLPSGGKINTAQGLDFLYFGASGSPGGTIALDAAPSGTFASFFTLAGCPLAASAGGCGTIEDLPTGSLVVGALSIANFWTISEGGITVTFDLDALTDVTRKSAGVTSLSISGSGMFNLPGYDPTPGVFTLSVQGSGETTFSAATEALSVPEPATLALFGTSLMGLGFAARRRKG